MAAESAPLSAVRIDKWLWAARFFKTRALASRACEIGRVQWNGQLAKPARDVRVGDRLQIKNDSGEFHLAVLALSHMRGPASIAQTLYSETEESKAARANARQERKLMPLFGSIRPGQGRPNKRDRRDLDRLRGRD